MAWWTEKRLHPKTKSRFVVVFGSDLFLPNVKSITKPKVEIETKEFRLLNHTFNYPGNGKWQPIDIKFVDMNGLGATASTFDTAAFLWQMLNNSGYAYPHLDSDSKVSTNPYYKNVKEGQVVEGHGHHISTKINFRDDPKTTDVVEGSTWRTITTPEKSSTIANSFGNGLNGDIDMKSAHYSRQKVSIYQISPEHPGDVRGGEKSPQGGIITEAWHLVNPLIKTIDWGDLAYDTDDLVEYSINIVYDWAIFDRDSIGKNVSALGYDPGSYNDFMKSWKEASESLATEAAIQETIAARQAEFDKLREKNFKDVDTILTKDADGAFFDAIDINNDGRIDESEILLSQTVEGRQYLEDKIAFDEEQLQFEKDKAEIDQMVMSLEQKQDTYKLLEEGKGRTLTEEEQEQVLRLAAEEREKGNNDTADALLSEVLESPPDIKIDDDEGQINDFGDTWKAEEQEREAWHKLAEIRAAAAAEKQRQKEREKTEKEAKDKKFFEENNPANNNDNDL